PGLHRQAERRRLRALRRAVCPSRAGAGRGARRLGPPVGAGARRRRRSTGSVRGRLRGLRRRRPLRPLLVLDGRLHVPLRVDDPAGGGPAAPRARGALHPELVLPGPRPRRGISALFWDPRARAGRPFIALLSICALAGTSIGLYFRNQYFLLLAPAAALLA